MARQSTWRTCGQKRGHAKRLAMARHIAPKNTEAIACQEACIGEDAER
jgi:hypothetical protein